MILALTEVANVQEAGETAGSAVAGASCEKAGRRWGALTQTESCDWHQAG